MRLSLSVYEVRDARGKNGDFCGQEGKDGVTTPPSPGGALHARCHLPLRRGGMWRAVDDTSSVIRRTVTRRMTPSPQVNADEIVIGILRTISALISSLFLAIHKVFLQKSAIIRTQILSQSALADFIIVYSRRRLWAWIIPNSELSLNGALPRQKLLKPNIATRGKRATIRALL